LNELLDEQSIRREICRIGKLMYDRNYVVGSDGNISVRLDDGRIIGTPTMTCKGRLTEELLAVTDEAGRALTNSKPSSELAMHILIYNERPDVRAVCHAHPPHATAFAAAGLAIDQPILSEVILTLGCVQLAGYGTPGTMELSKAMRPLIKDHNVLLMANHGAVAYAINLWQAFDRLETMEHTARIAILARILGGAKNLSSHAIEKLINVREAAGYLNENARCQACGYLHEVRLACPIGDRPSATSYSSAATNGAGKISLTREQLVDLLSQAVNNNR
jgi:L-fuculose-phosphate aldolase